MPLPDPIPALRARLAEYAASSTPLIPLENSIRIGPLAPRTSQSVRMRFLALSEGVHPVETLGLVGVDDGFAVNLKSVSLAVSLRRRALTDDLPACLVQVGLQRHRPPIACALTASFRRRSRGSVRSSLTASAREAVTGRADRRWTGPRQRDRSAVQARSLTTDLPAEGGGHLDSLSPAAPALVSYPSDHDFSDPRPQS
jgi:hypothetical protein